MEMEGVTCPWCLREVRVESGRERRYACPLCKEDFSFTPNDAPLDGRRQAQPSGVGSVPTAEFVELPFVKDLVDRTLVDLQDGLNVHLSGPAGSGKTTIALHVAQQLGRPEVLLHGDDQLGTSDLVGKESGYERTYNNELSGLSESANAATIFLLGDKSQRLVEAIESILSRAAVLYHLEAIPGIAESWEEMQRGDVWVALVYVAGADDEDQLTRLLRETRLGHAPVPVIALTAGADPDQRQRLLARGAVDCFPLPLDGARLVLLLGILTLRRRHVPSAARRLASLELSRHGFPAPTVGVVSRN